MDFFKDVQNKLKELEEQAQQMHQAEMQLRQEQQRVGGKAKRGQALFQPRNQSQLKRAGQSRSGGGEFKSAHHEGPAGSTFTRHDPNFTHHQPPKAGARNPIDSSECGPGNSATSASPRGGGGGGYVLDLLRDRLDEAFLIQEILGPPMCMREEE